MLKKYFTLGASGIIMLCIGGVYAWSIFVSPLKTVYHLTTVQTQMVFGLTIGVFTISMIFAGKIEKKYNARITAFIGMILFVIGYLLASISRGNIVVILIGIGLFSGAGIGFCYLTTLVTPVKWFPNKKGLITGLSVAGFGSGAILLSNIVEFLLIKNIDVLDIFKLLGLVYGLIILISLLFLFEPPKTENSKNISENSFSDLLKDRTLLGLFFGMFAGTFAGLMVVGNLKPIGLINGIPEYMATLGITFLALGNMFGRVMWGYLSDKLKGRTAIILALLLLSISTLALLTISLHGILFLIITFAIGIGFGANFVLFAKEVSNIYGIDNFGLIYPYIFLAYGLAGLTGPTIGGELFDLTQTYTPSIIVSSIICAMGIFGYNFFIKKKVSGIQH